MSPRTATELAIVISKTRSGIGAALASDVSGMPRKKTRPRCGRAVESAKDARPAWEKVVRAYINKLKRTKMTERSLDKLGIGRADATIDAHAQET